MAARPARGASESAHRLISLIGSSGRFYALEIQQIIRRLLSEFGLETLDKFNAGLLDAATTAIQVGVGRSQLYRMRTH